MARQIINNDANNLLGVLAMIAEMRARKDQSSKEENRFNLMYKQGEGNQAAMLAKIQADLEIAKGARAMDDRKMGLDEKRLSQEDVNNRRLAHLKEVDAINSNPDKTYTRAQRNADISASAKKWGFDAPVGSSSTSKTKNTDTRVLNTDAYAFDAPPKGSPSNKANAGLLVHQGHGSWGEDIASAYGPGGGLWQLLPKGLGGARNFSVQEDQKFPNANREANYQNEVAKHYAIVDARNTQIEGGGPPDLDPEKLKKILAQYGQ